MIAERSLVLAAFLLSIFLATLLTVRAFAPWSAIAEGAKRHARVLSLALLVPAAAIVESTLDPAVTRALGWDFTGILADFERGWHATLQAPLDATPIRIGVSIVYLVLYPVALFAPMLFFAAREAASDVRRAVGVFLATYALGLPFYLLTPVSEVWLTGAAENWVAPDPSVAYWLYKFNDVSNAFPSEHVAMTVALALVAASARDRGFAPVAIALAAATAIVVVIGGIHWVTDVVAGVAVAILAFVLVDRILKARTFSTPRPTGP